MQPADSSNQPDQTVNESGSMNVIKKRLFVTALLLIVLLTSVLVIRNSQSTGTTRQADSQLASQTAEVYITSQGFEPATVKIKKGQSVQWTNRDEAPHQIASDPHPTDDSLPGLNDDIPLNANNSFSYIFEESGTYAYHDELNPLKFNGTIIVED